MSSRTKELKKKYIALTVLSYCLCILPSLIWIIVGFTQATVTQKIVLTVTTWLIICVTLYNLIQNKLKLRGWIFILLIVLHNVLSSFISFLVVFTICYCLDELVIDRLAKKTGRQLEINKEIDKRDTV